MNKGKYLLFCFLLVILNRSAKAQDLEWLCDSVFNAMKSGSKEKLQALCPNYQDLKALYDTNDVELMNYQISIRQKELIYWTQRDMKRLVKSANTMKINLSKLEKVEYHYPLLENEEGRRFSNVQVKCVYQSKLIVLHFVLIELNGNWFYGEGLRIEKLPEPIEAVPDYEKIDLEREKRVENRKKRIEKEEREEQKRINQEKKEQERIEKERIKEEERVLKKRREEQRLEEQRLEEQRREEKRREEKRLEEQKLEEKRRVLEIKEKEKKEKEEQKRIIQEKKEQEKKEKERLRKEKEEKEKEEKKQILKEKKEHKKEEKKRLRKEKRERKKEEKRQNKETKE
jgi:hypothetical protein